MITSNSSYLRSLTKALEKAYCKILIVDLKNDSFIPIFVVDKEWKDKENLSLTQWVCDFVASDGVKTEDIKKFLSFMSLNNLKKVMNDSTKNAIRYSRKINGNYHSVLLEVYPSDDCDTKCIIYIRDIDEINYSINNIMNEEYTDYMTGFSNYAAYSERLNSLKGNELNTFVYVNIKNLKEINNTNGRVVGDKLIKKVVATIKFFFKHEDCFRLKNGDSFAVITDYTLDNLDSAHRLKEILDFICYVGISTESVEEAKSQVEEKIQLHNNVISVASNLDSNIK